MPFLLIILFQSAVPQMVGVIAGPKPAVAKVLSIIQELGLFINAEKCELLSLGDLSSFHLS